MKKIFLILLCSLTSYCFSQVGINTDEPSTNAVLDIKTKTGEHKGILLPQSTQVDRDGIPVVTATEDGLVLYNVDEDCFNYWSSSANAWKSLCGSMSKAQFTLDCSSISALGDYVINKNMTPTNYLSIKVNVTKPGIWNISATSSPSNGYSFVDSGVFTETGIQTITIRSQGAPQTVQTDTFTLTGTGTTATCTVPITVKTNIASYSLNCSSIVVNGQFVKGTALTSQSITLSVNVAAPGSYNISTPVTNGISFSASGTFTVTGTQSVTLSPVTGSNPTVNTDFPITIKANTVNGNNTCSTTIPMTLPAMTYGLIGNDTTYSWAGIRKTALQSGSSFGPTGTVKILGLSQAWATSTAATAATNLSTNPPDIVLYFAYNSPNSPALTTALVNYVNNGGVLIYASTSDPNGLGDTQTLMNGIFGNSAGTYAQWMTNCNFNCPGSYPNDDNAYLINNLPADPVISGPFGNLSGKYWAEDNGTTGTIAVTQLPPNSVQVASASNNWGHQNVNPAYSTVWYNDSKNFFMFGDTDGANSDTNDNGGYPACYSAAGLPLSKQYGNGDNTGSPFTNVAQLELNAVYWALKKAASSGINPH